NRSKGPAIEDVLGRAIVERIRTIDHTCDKLLPAVEVRKCILARLVKRIERQVVGSKRGRALTSVRRTRQRVVSLELQTSRQATISLQHERVILGNNVAANLSDLREPRIRTCPSKNRRQVSLAIEWSTDDVQ